MEGLVLTMVVAVTVEALVEYGKSMFLAVGNDKKAIVLQVAAMLVSVGICLLTGADIYSALGIVFVWQPVGAVLTGIFAARGANYLSDMIGRLKQLLAEQT